MSFPAVINRNFTHLRLSYFFKRAVLARIVAMTKVAFLGISLLFLIFLVWQVVSDYTSATQTVLSFQNDAQRIAMNNTPQATSSSSAVSSGGAASSSGAAQNSLEEYRVIGERNVFGPLMQATALPTPRVVAASKVPLALVGTFISGNTKPYAIIENQSTKSQEVFDLHEMVFNEGKLEQISSDRVELMKDGVRTVLTIDEVPDNGGAISTLPGVESSEVTVQESEIDKALENLPLLLTQARAVPYFQDGKASGLRLFSIRPGSLFEKVGLQNGDILKTINGSSMADFSQAMQLFEKLKTERNLALVLERNNQAKEFRYQIR